MLRTRVSLFAFVSALAIAAPAAAQVAPSFTADTSANFFTLRNGSTLQARVADIRPGQYVVVVLPDATQRTIAWVDIVHAEGPSFPGGYTTTLYTPMPNGATTIAPEMYSDPAPDRVQLVIESVEQPLQIGELLNSPGTGGSGSAGGGYTTSQGQFAGGGGTASMPTFAVGRWLCTTPCTLYVPRDFRFRISAEGPGLHPTDATIPMHSTPLRARLRLMSQARFWGAVGAIAGFGIAFVGGGGLVLYGAFTNASSSYYPTRGDGTALEVAGGVLIGASVAALVTGIVLLTTRRGLESLEPLANPSRPQVTIGPIIGQGAAGAVTWRF